MGVLDHLSNLRFHRAVERYAQVGGRANAGRAGTAAAPAVAARAAAHADSQEAAGGAQAPPGGVLATVARGIMAAIELEQNLTAPLGLIPFPTIPALRVWDLDVGLPHAHNHPPNITPPNPVPIPLPSMGPVIPIPFLSGASKVLINGTAAARCGDMGLGIWCGGYFPMFEVFLGSSTVWIESARAARVVVDVTKHCIFSAPKPSDPPLGPMVGTTLPPGSPNVQIGGFPFPSLFSLAIAQAFKWFFRGAGFIFRRLTARSYVQRMLRNGSLRLHAPPGTAWYDDMVRDLERVARTRTGRNVLNRIGRSGNTVDLVPYNGWFPTRNGPVWAPHNAWAAPRNADGLMDMPTGLRMPGSDATVAHNPAAWANHPGGGIAGAPQRTASDGILLHELNHAANATEGGMRQGGTTAAHGWDQRWNNFEEYNTVGVENGHRAETGLPGRTNYTSPMP